MGLYKIRASVKFLFMNKLFPVVLCGGSGSRLWPLSRDNFPKQFLPHLAGDVSLFKQTVSRCALSAEQTTIVTNDKFRFLVNTQLNEIGYDNARILIEPSQKNTAPAILAAAVDLLNRGEDGIMLVMPSDHYIPDRDAFNERVAFAAENIADHQIICFGIKPGYPETGYGYIQTETNQDDLMKVISFKEKPDHETAVSFLENGNYFWNAGIFMFRASSIVTLARDIAVEMLGHVQQAVDRMTSDLNFFRLEPESWGKLTADSFDYAVMEKTKTIACVAFGENWSDLGDWNSVSRMKPHDAQGNILLNSAHSLDCQNTILWSEKDGQIVTGLGLDNIIVVSTGDAIMVADRSKTQRVKNLLTELKNNSVKQASEHLYDHRPWGWFESISETATHKVKRLHILPHCKLSLQYHLHRSENWVVTSGQATVILDGRQHILNETESIFIKAGVHHQLINDTDQSLEIIEVQTGTYFGEDDIIRVNDEYNRR